MSARTDRFVRGQAEAAADDLEFVTKRAAAWKCHITRRCGGRACVASLVCSHSNVPRRVALPATERHRLFGGKRPGIMSYTEEIARRLIETLSKTAGLPTFQLASHVPNLAFWMAEVKHALDVVDGYPKCFADMVAAQTQFDANYPDGAQSREHHEYNYQPPRLALSPAHSERLKRELVRMANRLIDRCLNEGLLDVMAADDLRQPSTRGSPAAK
jgi:hypothetical protein